MFFRMPIKGIIRVCVDITEFIFANLNRDTEINSQILEKSAHNRFCGEISADIKGKYFSKKK